MNRLPSLVLLVCVLSGCGTGGYDEGMQQQLGAARQQAPFLKLYKDGSPIEGTNRTIRLPAIFKLAYQEGSAHPRDAGPIDARRLQPPFLALPGLRVCYESTVQEGTELYPYYCYIAAEPMKPEDRNAFENELLTKLKQTFPEAAWESIDVRTPAGATISWKKVSVKGEQTFMGGGVPSIPVKYPGTFELWLHEGDAGVIMIGWRCPDALAAKIELDKLAEATAGTLGTKPDAAAPVEGQPAATQ
jgi:hypothetical protein